MNFALILFILTVVTGVFWVADRRVFLPKRREAARAAVTAFEAPQPRSALKSAPTARRSTAATRA